METTEIAQNAALLVIDVQKGFDDPVLQPLGRNNRAAERNMESLLDAWQGSGRPVVFVRHTSLGASTPLRAGTPGNDFQDFVQARRGLGDGPELLVDKTVNSAFLGTPGLGEWLTGERIGQIVIAGIQTNRCVETTARMGGNLGYEVLVPLDATYTFGDSGPGGEWLDADQLSLATSVNLHSGGFARIVATAEVLAAAGTETGAEARPRTGGRAG